MFSCACCGCTDKNGLVIVVVGQEQVVLCNGKSQDDISSHALQFIRKMKNYSEVKRLMDNQTIRCTCGTKRIGSLGVYAHSNGYKVTCDRCQNNEDMYQGFTENDQLNVHIVPEPDVSRIQKIKSINAIINEIRIKTRGRLPDPPKELVPAKETYSSMNEYTGIISEFVKIEQEIGKKISHSERLSLIIQWTSEKSFIFYATPQIRKKLHAGLQIIFEPDLDQGVTGYINSVKKNGMGRAYLVGDNKFYNNDGNNHEHCIRTTQTPIPYNRQLIALANFGEKYDISNRVDNIYSFFSEVFLGRIREVNAYNRVVLPSNIIYPDNIPINKSQKKAIKTALSQRFTIIQGPPGTGKSTTIAALTKTLLENYNDKHIVILAHSNAAVDNVAEILLDYSIDCVRVYGKKSEEFDEDLLERLQKISSKTLAEKKFGISKKKTYSKNDEKKIFKVQMDIIRDARVVCTTTSCAGGARFKKAKFDFVIIDEASQCLDPDLLIPLTQGAKQVALFGDHKQISPFVKSNRCKEAKYNISLIERFQKLGFNINMLAVQYRMHPAIAKFASDTFYDSKIKDSNSVTNGERFFPYRSNFIDDNFPLLFWHVEDSDSLDSSEKSIKNTRTCNLVFSLLKHFKSIGVPSDKVSVMTPYNGQLDLYFNTCVKRFNEDDYEYQVEKDTIDSFQGRENDIIIFDAVRSNKRCSIGFLADLKRMNVALTRAKYALIVIGNAEVFKESEEWKSFVMYCHRNRAIFTPINDTLKRYKPSYA